MKTKTTMAILIAMALVISVFAAAPVLSFGDVEADSPLMEASDQDISMIELESSVKPQVGRNDISIEMMGQKYFNAPGMQPTSQQDPGINQDGWHWMYDADWRPDWVSAVGVGVIHTWYGAMRIELPAGEIQQVAFFHLDGADYMKGLIYTDDGTTPGDLIAETNEVSDPPVEQWIEEPIVDPVTIDAGHYWVVIEVADDGTYFPFGVVDPFIEDAGWLSFDGADWQTLPEANPDLDYSWMLEVYVELAPGDPPEITLTQPVGGEEWVAHTEENITWTTEVGEDPISHVNLEYSADAGVTWANIDTGLDDAGEYAWTIPNENSEQCLVRATVVDTAGRSSENVSGEFEISGFPPASPQNLIVEHHSTTVLFEDDVEGGDLGYITATSHPEASEWGIRQHGASSGVNSWDFGDGEFNKEPDHGMLSSLVTPEIEIPADADQDYGALFTFQHWRDFGDEGLFDGGNVKVSWAGLEGPWYIVTPQEGYDGEIWDQSDNPLAGQPGWGGSSDWTTATLDLTVLIGETIHVRWDAGIEDFDGGEGAGWRVDEIYMDVLLPEAEDTDDNLLTWDSSPDEDIGEVSHYNIYRSNESDGTYDHIGSVVSDGSVQYQYLDIGRGTADEVYWWYIVRAVGANGLEEQNEDAKQEPGDPGVTPPSITLTHPVGGEEWNAGTSEDITWTSNEGDYIIDYINIWFSPDNGDTWSTVATYLNDTGTFTWAVPDIHTSEAFIRTRVVDTAGRWSEDESEVFDILGTPVTPPMNLTVEYVEYLGEDWHWMYPTGHREITPENSIGLSGEGYWYGAIRTELPAGLITDIAYFDFDEADHVRAMVYTDAGTPANPEPGDLIAETEVVTDLGNMVWLEMAILEPVFIESDDYWIILAIYDIGDGFFPFGAIEPYVADTGWLSFDMVDWDETIDYGLDLSWTLEALVLDIDVVGDNDNHISWGASPDETPGTVSHYNIYRSEVQSGPWDESTLIDSVPAKGSEAAIYSYIDIDRGTADNVWWWYVVRAEGYNWYEDQNTDAVQEPDAPIDTFDIPLYAGGDADGWNFVSFNLIPSDTSLEAILEDPIYGVSGNYDKLMYYDAVHGEWSSYVPGRAERFNSLDTWNHHMGIWIHMTTTDTLTIQGNAPASTDLNLHPGWTMVGLPSEAAGNHGIPGGVDVIGYFDGTQVYNLAYDNSPDLFLFEPGQGYWIHNPTDAAIVWTVNY